MSIENTQILAEILPSALVGRRGLLIGIDIDGLVEGKDIQPSALLAQFTEKRVFVTSCGIPNFSRSFSLHSGIPLTIFTVISSNISLPLWTWMFFVEKGFCFVLLFYQQYFLYFQLPGLLRYFFL